MKLLIAALGIVATLPSLAAQASPLESATRSFTITLHAGFDRAFESFGPVEEKNWSPEFDPAFIYRSGIDMHPDFAVFTTSHGAGQLLWVMSAHDRDRGFTQYVNVDSGKMVTVIEIQCVKVRADQTRATVTYRKTALAESSNVTVQHFAEHFAAQASHWEQAMNDYFDHQKQGGK